MKLLLRRSERASILNKPIYVLDVRAELSAEEIGWIDKFKFGPTLLYTRKGKPNFDALAAGVSGVGSLLLHYATDMTVSVNDLKNGKRIEFKDIREMIAAEEQIKEAARNFSNTLSAGSQFGGDEVIEL